MSRYGKSSKRGGRDSKYFRLTGLWQSKKNDKLFTGKLRGQDVEKLIAKLEEADGEDIAFFLWENDQESRKDPIFTLQCTVSEGDGFKKRRNREDDEDEEDERPRRGSRKYEDEEEDDDDTGSGDDGDGEEEEDEKPSRKYKAAKKTSKASGKSKGKKDEDW